MGSTADFLKTVTEIDGWYSFILPEFTRAGSTTGQ